ncbi:MAG: hypothetical protein SNH27_15645, partial [Rikenellaceae bacterium]
HFYIATDPKLTDRAKEVMTNVTNYIMSYNYDDSDPMTDYFCTNFYLTLGIGRHDKPFEVVVPQLACPKGKEALQFKFPEGKAHKAIRLALNGALFGERKFRDGEVRKVLGTMHYYSNEASFYPKIYSAPKTAQKRILKLQAAGVECYLQRSYIVFDGYTPETQKALNDEIIAEKIAKERWIEQLHNPKSTAPKPKDADENIEVESGSIKVVDYSDKSFAIIGETKSIKEQLKELGGRFNPRLTCGAGWVFPKTKLETVMEALSIAS